MGLSKLIGQLFYNRKQDQKQLGDLYKMAEADGIVVDSEEKLLSSLADKHKISPSVLDKIKSHDLNLSQVSPPKDDKTKFEHLYEMVAMMVVDGKVAREEQVVCNSFASYLGYQEQNIDELVVAVTSNVQNGNPVPETMKRVERLLV